MAFRKCTTFRFKVITLSNIQVNIIDSIARTYYDFRLLFEKYWTMISSRRYVGVGVCVCVDRISFGVFAFEQISGCAAAYIVALLSVAPYSPFITTRFIFTSPLLLLWLAVCLLCLDKLGINVYSFVFYIFLSVCRRVYLDIYRNPAMKSRCKFY